MGKGKKKILVVEDSPMVLKIIKHVLSQSRLIVSYYAENFAQAKELLATEDDWFAAMVDLNLPDAPNGEVVDFTLQLNLPTIVLTGSFDEERQEILQSKGIVDYVTKEGRFSYEYALGVVHRLIKNLKTQVLVVDDSSTSRKAVCGLLRKQLYQVFEASDGIQAIKVLLENPSIKLLITDYNMPRMDGFELVKNLRCKYGKSDLVIIGVSSEGDSMLSAKFIKNGANDFLKKPFNHEEFYCRVSHNVEFLELIEKIKDAANRDELTGIYNKKYFLEVVSKKYAEALAKNSPLAICVIDLDELADINETYGSEAGAKVMQYASRRFIELFERFTLACVGGHEFFVCMPGLSNDKAVALIEKIRQILRSESLSVDDNTISITFSAGISNIRGENLDEMVLSAEKCLLRARDAGGDLVYGDEE